MPDLKTPTAAAKVLDIRPQMVYGLLKRNKIKEHRDLTDEGKIKVDMDELRKWFSAKRQGRPTSKPKTAGKLVAKPGKIITWGTQVGRRIAAVTENEDDYTYGRTADQKEIFFRDASLEKLVNEGRIMFEDPWHLLDIVALAWDANEPELAASLRHWGRLKRETVEREPVPESSDSELVVEAGS